MFITKKKKIILKVDLKNYKHNKNKNFKLSSTLHEGHFYKSSSVFETILN